MLSVGELIEVVSVVVEESFIISVAFSNGQIKKLDFSTFLKNPLPVFVPLCNKKEFEKVSVNPVGGIQWECNADLSADYLLTM